MRRLVGKFFLSDMVVFAFLSLTPGSGSAAPPVPATLFYKYTIQPKPIRSILGHADNISCVALIRDGKALLTASKDKTIKLWDLKTGKKLRSFLGHHDMVTALAVDNDQRFMASGDFSGEVRVWDLRTGEGLLWDQGVKSADMKAFPVGAVDFSPDGDKIAVGWWNSRVIILDRISSDWVRSADFTRESDGVSALYFGQDGNKLFVGYRNGELIARDIKTGNDELLFQVASEVAVIKVSLDNKWLAVGTTRNKLVVFDLANMRVSWKKRLHRGSVNTLAFLDHGNVIASGGSDKRLLLTRVDNGKILSEIKLSSDVRSLDVDDKSLTLAVASGINSGKEVSLFAWTRSRTDEIVHQDLPIQADLSAGQQDKPPATQQVAIPPVIFLAPLKEGAQTGKKRVTISGEVRLYHKKGLRSLTFLVNGNKIDASEDQRGIILKGKAQARAGYMRVPFNRSLPIGVGSNSIEIKVVDGLGHKASEDLFIERSVRRGKLWVVSIGIDKFSDKKIPDLNYAVADANLVAEYFKSFFQLPENHLILLLNQYATTKNVKTTLGTILKKKAGKDDTVIIFFAGHGSPEPDAESPDGDGFEKYLLTYDSRFDDLYGTGLPMREIRNIFSRIKSERLIFIADTCFSGAAGGRTLPRPGLRAATLNEKVWERLSTGKGRIILTASSANELSQEAPELGHGVFTYYLVEGLKGKADLDNDGYITVDEVYSYVSKKVPEDTGQNQHPLKKGESSGQFILGRY